MTQSHPKQTEGSDIYVGTSFDQLFAQRFGQDTPIPSMQLCIENVQAGGCAFGYQCAYTDNIRWASPTEPLPVIRDPRVAFEQLFGVGGTDFATFATVPLLVGMVAITATYLPARRASRVDPMVSLRAE